MAEAKKAEVAGKKKAGNSRPRIDAVIRHIKAGSYDDDMGMLKGAIEDRLKVRQEAVLGLVKETFGEDFVVQPKSVTVNVTAPATPLDPEAVSEWVAAEKRARQEEARLAAEAGATVVPDALPADEDLGPDHESHSPVIGHVPDNQSEELVVEPDSGPKKNPFLE